MTRAEAGLPGWLCRAARGRARPATPCSSTAATRKPQRITGAAAAAAAGRPAQAPRPRPRRTPHPARPPRESARKRPRSAPDTHHAPWPSLHRLASLRRDRPPQDTFTMHMRVSTYVDQPAHAGQGDVREAVARGICGTLHSPRHESARRLQVAMRRLEAAAELAARSGSAEHIARSGSDPGGADRQLSGSRLKAFPSAGTPQPRAAGNASRSELASASEARSSLPSLVFNDSVSSDDRCAPSLHRTIGKMFRCEGS